MTPEERDAFLAEQRTVRVGTINPDGSAHVTPVWYSWHDGSLWVLSITRSQRWANLQRDPRMTAVIDAGEDYFELRGVELRGRAEFVGEQPRLGGPEPRLEEPERLFAERYGAGQGLIYDGRHAWIRLAAEKEVSWDFRKLGGIDPALSGGEPTVPPPAPPGHSPPA